MTAPPVPTPTSLTARRAVVTGGARGIGATIADHLSRAGATVTILDRLPADDSARACGGEAIQVDLADPADTVRAMTAAIEGLGGIDVLVNSAGIFALSPLLDIEPEAWDAMLDVNARATLITMQCAGRAMMAGSGGVIINLASMAAKSGGAMEGHYAASKAAVVALTRAAAIEWGPQGIRANAICPGYVLTEMGSSSRTDEQVASWAARSPLGRLGTPEDVASLATYLAGDAAGYITGQSLNLTGGMVMH